MRYSDENIKDAYNQVLYSRARKQKEEIDVRAFEYIVELERRSEKFKRQVIEDAERQIELINQNTRNFKNQIKGQAEMHKRMIDENTKQMQKTQVLSLNDVKSLMSLLMNS